MRIKTGKVTRQRHKKWIELAEGSYGSRHRQFKVAKQTAIRASQYSYRDRRNKKRDFRKLWIARINAAVREQGYTYSQFIHQLDVHKIDVNRKMLSEMAIDNREEFNALVEKAMK